MFGFIVTNQVDLSQQEKDRYQQVYCGVCRALQQRYGERARLALNNDLTFMALLHLSLYEPSEIRSQGPCVMHPLGERVWVAAAPLDYAADMTVMLAYHKALDDWKDEGRRRGRLYANALDKGYAQVRERWPGQCEATERALAGIHEAERRAAAGQRVGPDEAANLFGTATSPMFSPLRDIWQDKLASFGYEIGRFIYMMDAAVDLAGDVESGTYNPFAGTGFTSGEMRLVLTTYIARAAGIFEQLPIVSDAHLLRSVLYAGVWQQFDRIYGGQTVADGGEMERTAH